MLQGCTKERAPPAAGRRRPPTSRAGLSQLLAIGAGRPPRPCPPTCPKQRFTRSPTVTSGQSTQPLSCVSARRQAARTVPPKLRVASAPWSPLGPCGIRNRWSSVGTNGHLWQMEIAGQRRSTAATSDSEAALDRVRTPPDGCRGPAALANQAGVTEDGPHPAAEVVPSPPGPSHVHPRRPCPGRALSIGRQRSFTDNHGR
jgi:hypothetical protein